MVVFEQLRGIDLPKLDSIVNTNVEITAVDVVDNGKYETLILTIAGKGQYKTSSTYLRQDVMRYADRINSGEPLEASIVKGGKAFRLAPPVQSSL